MPLAMAGQQASALLPLHLQPCGMCGSQLKATQINLEQQMYLCADQQCPYPLNTGRAASFLVSHPILTHLRADLLDGTHSRSAAASYDKHDDLTEHKDARWNETAARLAAAARPLNSGAPAAAAAAQPAPPVLSASSALAALKRGKGKAPLRNSGLGMPQSSYSYSSVPMAAPSALAFSAAAFASTSSPSPPPAAFSPALHASSTSPPPSGAYYVDFLSPALRSAPSPDIPLEDFGTDSFASSSFSPQPLAYAQPHPDDAFAHDPNMLQHSLDDFGQHQQLDSEVIWE